QQQPGWARERVDHRPQAATQLLLGRSGAVTEDSLHDHAERQRLHAWQYLKGLPDRPGIDLRVRALLDHLLVDLHAATVERWKQKPTLSHMLGPVEQQYRALAEHGPEQRIGLP